MRVYPAQNRIDGRECLTLWQGRAVDQNDRNPQGSGRFQLSLRPHTTRVLGDDMGDAMGLKQYQIIRLGKRAARNDGLRVRQGQRPLRWIDQPQKVMVLGARGKGRKVLLANRQEDPRRVRGQGFDSGLNVRHRLPAIPRTGNPRGAFKRTEANAGLRGGGDGIAAHPGGERMGRVNQMADLFGPQIVHQPRDPAKPADARGQGLGHRGGGAPGIGKDRLNTRVGHGPRERCCFGGSAQKKDAVHG